MGHAFLKVHSWAGVKKLVEGHPRLNAWPIIGWTYSWTYNSAKGKAELVFQIRRFCSPNTLAAGRTRCKNMYVPVGRALCHPLIRKCVRRSSSVNLEQVIERNGPVAVVAAAAIITTSCDTWTVCCWPPGKRTADGKVFYDIK